MSGEDIEFRTWDIERKDIRERNIEKTQAILDNAGITPENPNYKRYYNATMVNVNNAYRYSYNGETDAMLDKVLEEFSATIKDPNVSIDDYERVTQEFLRQRVTKQFENADGAYAHAETYENMREKLNETIKSGMEMREVKGTTYPKEFYTQSGSLQRLVIDIPPEMQEESAMRSIDMIVAKYKNNGVKFSFEDNAFIVKGQKVGPEKFFTSRAKSLSGFMDKFNKDQTILDMGDKELLDILEKGDYPGFLELAKQRGISRDKTNEALRVALKDEVVFREVCSEGFNRSQLLHRIENVYDDFERTAQTVSKESEKTVLGRVDRVMLSAVPEDLATQSTLRNWKSCMHTTGCNHKFVDDSIGLGSIVAYGYDSQNPQKQVSRLLIHPYYDEKGNVAYRVNDRIYGKDNTGFRRAVQKATQHFNEGKYGWFDLAKGLYNDNGGNSRLNLLRRESTGEIVLNDLAKDGEVVLDSYLQSSIQPGDKVIISDDLKVVFQDFKVPDGTDFSACKNLTFKGKVDVGANVKLPETISVAGRISDGADLSGAKTLVLDSEINFGSDIKLPKNIEMSPVMKVSGSIPDGIDLSQAEKLTLNNVYRVGEDIKFPKTVLLSGTVSSGVDLSSIENLQLDHGVNFGRDVILPENVQLSEFTHISGNVPDGTDLSQVKKLTLRDIDSIGKNVKFPETVFLSGTVSSGVDLSGGESLLLDHGVNSGMSENILGGAVDFSGVKKVVLDTEVDFGSYVKLPENVDASSVERIRGNVPSGIDLSQAKNLTLDNIEKVGENVKFPETITVSGGIFNGADLSKAHQLTLDNIGYVGYDIKLPEKIHILGGVPNGVDLSQTKQLTMHNVSYIGTGIKLPETVTVSGEISGGVDLSQIKRLRLDNVGTIGENVELPETIVVSGHIPDGADLSGIKKISLESNVDFGKNVKLPENVDFSPKLEISGHIPDGMDFTKVQDLSVSFKTSSEVAFGKDVKLPSNTKFLEQSFTLVGNVPDGIDLSDKYLLSLNNVGHIGENVKFSEHLRIKGYIPDGTDFSSARILWLDSDVNFGKDVKLPKDLGVSSGIKVSGRIPDGMDLSSIDDLALGGDVNFGKDVKLPKNIKFSDYTYMSGYIPQGADFSQAQKLNLTDISYIGKDVKLPETVSFSGIIPDGADLSSAKNLELSVVNFGKDVKLPENIKFSDYTHISGYIPDGMDFSKIEHLTIEGDITFGKGVEMPEKIESGWSTPGSVSGYIPDGFKVKGKLTGDVWLGKDVDCGYGCIDKNNPPRIHGDVVCDFRLEGADFSKAESVVFPSGSMITSDAILPENGNVKFEELIIADSQEAIHKIAKYDVRNCVVLIESKGEPISTLPNNIDVLIAKEADGKVEINAVYKNAQSREKLQEICKAALVNNEDTETVPEINYSTQEEFTKRSGVKFTEVEPLKGEQNTAEAVATKAAEKSAEEVTAEAVTKATTKSALKSQSLKIGAKAKVAAKTAGKATKETLLAVNKAYDKTFDAVMDWGNKHAPQWMNKVEEATVQKAAEKFMKTKSGQAIAKQIEKKIGKKAAVSIAKKIPILCLGVGAACVYDRLKDGEYMKAVGEGASALVANVPGFGTLASFGLDGAMLSDDLKIFEHGMMKGDPNSHVAAESTFVEKTTVQERFERKVDKVAEAKQKKEMEAKANKFKENLNKYGSGKSAADFFDR